MSNKIQEILHKPEGRQLSEPTPNEGPALYQDSGVYNAAIDQNLATLKDVRAFQNEFDKKERNSDRITKAGVGLGVVAASALLLVSNGGPNRMYHGIKTFPEQVTYLFEGPAGNSQNK